MSTQNPVDTEDILHINKKKYYNFDIDAVDKNFTYVNDEDSALIENAEKVLEEAIDTLVLDQVSEVKAGSWIGINQRSMEASGGGDGADTSASIATSATGGTITVDADGPGQEVAENGSLYRLGFNASELGRPIRLVSTSGKATDWWKISGVTSSAVVSVENWDGNVATGSTGKVSAGDILYGLHLADTGGNVAPDDGGPTTENGWFYEIQAAIPTTLTKTNVYQAITELATKLDNNDVPTTDRKLIVPPDVYNLLRNASELQPAISIAYEGVILNGKVGNVAGFDVHLATGARVSSRAGRQTVDSDYGDWANGTFTTGTTGKLVLAAHRSFCTFAHKWSESRVVDSQLQFAKLYQGLNLYGVKVPALRRKMAALLYCTV